MNELHLFAGAGGGILGGMLLGHTTVCAVEFEPYCQKVLLQRQQDGILPKFPIWDDVTTFDGTPWRGKIDVVCGGFPCQDVSVANPKGKGIEGSRSGLWTEMHRIIGEIMPTYIFIENSPMLTSRGGSRVVSDIAAMGYDCRWGIVGSRHTDSPMRRDRMWILACCGGFRRETSRQGKMDSKFQIKKKKSWEVSTNRENNLRLLRSRYSDEILSRNFRGCDEFSCRMDRLTAIGNAQVPIVAATAWRILGGE
jgi:DNA (cytosine-5)-methyltransferase 1